MNYISEWNHYLNPDGNNRSGSGSSVGVPSGAPYGADQKQYNGWIADGISITLGDASGKPIAHAPVTFTISGKEKQFWFTKTPCILQNATWNSGSPTNLRTITLMTDANGFIALDGGPSGTNLTVSGQLIGYDGTWGYLRKGQDDSTKTTLTVSSSGHSSKSVQIWNYSPTNGSYRAVYWPGLRVATALSPCPAPNAP